ncbi:MAG: peptidylprolyl isomerase [Actinobacteria bacterium]|nr:peptidylprolyl isomerase [Actinomycetota bacterium]
MITTNKGDLEVLLDAAKAPGTVNNFVNLARAKYFDDTVCHRAIPTFVVQCGDPTATGGGGPGYAIADELPQVQDYKIGSLAMANSGPNTNGSQFFFITGEQGVSLPPNYSLFGQITSGIDTTLVALDQAGNPDPASNGVPPTEELRIIKVTITQG